MNTMRFHMNNNDSFKLSTDISSRQGQASRSTRAEHATRVPKETASVEELAFAAAVVDVDPAAEDAYWAAHFHSCPYIAAGTPYTEYRAAYRFGWESRRRLPDTSWDIAKSRLRAEWSADPANFLMHWGEAESAVRDAWNHAGAQRPN